MKIIEFTSKQFDVFSEPENDLNPIHGHDLAEFLRQELKNQNIFVSDEVMTEDWGWYFELKSKDQSYTIGTTSYVEIDSETEKALPTDEPLDHMVQIEKQRSFSDKIFGKNKMENADPLVQNVEKILNDKVKDITNMQSQ